ncbi:MAG: ABC transporter permease [Acidobacteria bacterium]|nr:ABC transporter permease [Acidobacteriota bacterium]
MHRKSDPRASKQIPTLAEKLLLLFSPADERDGLAGDLAEEYLRHRLPTDGRLRAWRWYWGQVLRSLIPGLARPQPDFSEHPSSSSRVAGARGGPPNRGELLSDYLHDIRYATRMLIKSPAFSVITVVTLALAIGVNSAIFSMINVVFFSDIPIRDGDTVGFFYMQNPERGFVRQSMSLPDFLDYREGITAFEGIAALRQETAVLTGTDEPIRTVVATGTANIFDLWGTQPALGRGFLEGEDEPGAQPVVILSNGLWQRRFAMDPDVLGQTISLDGRQTTIIGVMGTEMEFGDMSRIDLWTPMEIDRSGEGRDRRDLFVTARLAPGMTLETARSEAAIIAQRLERDYPESNGGWLPDIQSFTEGLADASFWTILTLLIIMVGFVMLIACSNVATMTMARSTARAREIALRSALGAGRFRLLRQLITEGAMLSIAAGALGLAVARGTLEGLVWMAGDNSGISTFFRMLSIDRNVLAFTLTVALLAPLLFSLLPALRATRQSLTDTLSEAGAQSSGGRSALRGRRFLVSAQVALALSLMIVAGILARSMMEVRTLDLGYDGETLLTMRVDLPETKYANAPLQQEFFRAVIERLRAHPEIDAAAWVSRRPMATQAARGAFQISGRVEEDPERLPWAGVVVADAEYPDILNRWILRGRGIRTTDTEDSLPVVLINDETADRYWPEEDPVGRRIQLAADTGSERWLEVIGVLANDEPTDSNIPARPVIFVPLQQNPRSSMALIVRPRGAALQAAPLVRELIWEVDPDQPVADVRTMRQVFNDAFAGLDAVMAMHTGFAAFAMFMAAAGIYGVMSFAVAQRTREFGIRMALGATGTDVRSMVMRNSLLLIVSGTIVGLLAGYALGTVLANGVEGVAADDPLVFVVVAALLMGVALISIYIPACRATRVDPMIALRAE